LLETSQGGLDTPDGAKINHRHLLDSIASMFIGCATSKSCY